MNLPGGFQEEPLDMAEGRDVVGDETEKGEWSQIRGWPYVTLPCKKLTSRMTESPEVLEETSDILGLGFRKSPLATE